MIIARGFRGDVIDRKACFLNGCTAIFETGAYLIGAA
jgi:hypothetical protein